MFRKVTLESGDLVVVGEITRKNARLTKKEREEVVNYRAQAYPCKQWKPKRNAIKSSKHQAYHIPVEISSTVLSSPKTIGT